MTIVSSLNNKFVKEAYPFDASIHTGPEGHETIIMNLPSGKSNTIQVEELSEMDNILELLSEIRNCNPFLLNNVHKLTPTHFEILSELKYDLSKGEFPITTLRPIAIKSAIKEVLWIYQDQTNSLEVLNDKYNVHYWNDWEVGDTGTIGERYGAVVKKHDIINKILKQLEANPWNRRNIISLWDYQAFEETDGLLPCAFQTMFDVRRVDGEIYLDATLTQRSNDMLVAHHINAMQYVALQMMIAKHFSWKVGKFFYFINNLHIYDNQFEQAQEILRREPSNCQPRLVLNVPDGTNFFDIKTEDFELLDYEPVKPQLKFDLAI